MTLPNTFLDIETTNEWKPQQCMLVAYIVTAVKLLEEWVLKKWLLSYWGKNGNVTATLKNPGDLFNISQYFLNLKADQYMHSLASSVIIFKCPVQYIIYRYTCIAYYKSHKIPVGTYCWVILVLFSANAPSKGVLVRQTSVNII